MFFLLLVILLLRACLIALYIVDGPLPLAPDEAQYWTWSNHLSYGYYSKPPGIAWQIFISSFFFGSNEWGVRVSALFWGSLLPISLYFAAKKAGWNRQTAFWIGFTAAFSPFGIVGSILAVTDGGMLVFWTLAMALFLQSIKDDRAPNPLYFGGIIALGALFKWPIYILPAVTILFSWTRFPTWRSSLFKSSGIALLGLIPSLIWNAFHDFATFRHTYTTLIGGENHPLKIVKGNFWEFFGAQFALFSPILFFLFLKVSYNRLRGKKTRNEDDFLFSLSLVLLIPLLMSLLQKIQGNWAVFVFPSSFLLVVSALIRERRIGWLLTSIGLSISLVSFLLFLPCVQQNNFGFISIPFRANPFKNALGWRNLDEALRRVSYDPTKQYLVAESYQMTSLLSFYSPQQEQAYFLNIRGRRHNQFDYWNHLSQDKREEGIFVTELRGLEEDLGKAFGKVVFLEEIALFTAYNKPALTVFLYRVSDYRLNFEKELLTNGW